MAKFRARFGVFGSQKTKIDSPVLTHRGNCRLAAPLRWSVPPAAEMIGRGAVVWKFMAILLLQKKLLQ